MCVRDVVHSSETCLHSFTFICHHTWSFFAWICRYALVAYGCSPTLGTSVELCKARGEGEEKETAQLHIS